MLKKMNKNSGMSLIEVIVSMLVLSIAVVAVTMSFSAASKVNMSSRQKQSTEALMENLLEYAEAGGTDYQSWFDHTAYQVEQNFDDVTTVRKELLEGVSQGFQTYDVRVITDRAPAEYEKDKLNNASVIQFGGSGSNTVLIDASLKGNDKELIPSGVSDYDETAYEYFYTLHSSAVLEHNMIEAQKALEIPGYTENEWYMVDEDVIPDIVDRELWLVVTKPTTDKMQLTAYMTYMLSTTKTVAPDVHQVHLPDGISYTYQIPIFVSEMYDLASDTDDDAKKLDQIYILYSKATEEEVTGENNLGVDIRLLDAQAEHEKALSANVFLICQESGSMSVDTAIQKDGLDNRAEATNIKMSCKDLDGNDKSPVKAEVYCSGTLALDASTDVTPKNNNLAAKGEEVRIVTTTLVILEAGTDKVLASKEVTHLQ